MNKDIEVEVRGPLNKKQYNNLVEFFSKKTKLKTTKNRVFIDYSTLIEGQGLKNRNKDIRLRVTNGIPEIIIKIGEWGENESRREISIKTLKGSFDDLVEAFGILGFKKGVLCVRNSKVYDYKGVEFALVEVPNHSFYYEAEKMIWTNGDKKQAIKEISNVCRELKLDIFNKEDFFKYVNCLNKEANEIFDSSSFKKNYFKNRFSL